MSISSEARTKVTSLLCAGQRPAAIQYLNDTFGISFQDAEALVHALENEMAAVPSMNDPLKAEVAQLLMQGRKAEAVRHVRSNLKLGLKEAVMTVDSIGREVMPGYVAVYAGGCFRTMLRVLGVFLMVVSSSFLLAAGVLWFLQWRTISKSDLVPGVVTRMDILDNGASAPVVEFEWKGSKRSYASTFYSTPPDYYTGQTLMVFVSRDDPREITLDTYSDRYALIVGLGTPGAVLLAISIVCLHFGRRKF